MVCPQCHQPVTPEQFFCPNCGAKLSDPPLSTNTSAQILLYVFSIVLPVICYLAVTKWQGAKYIKSPDPKAQQIGWIAAGLLAASTIITFWLYGVWINQALQSSLGGLGGGLGGASGLGL